ncbi:MAG: hypothetical protein NTX14_01040, partial [Candidatus Nealsonbacteria bacterium]|nr:hypothetical protein [Candidatus Nealsonbacteria bacterium]
LGAVVGIRLVHTYWIGILVLTATLGSIRFVFGGGTKEERHGRAYKVFLVLHVGALTLALFGFDFLLKRLGESSYQALLIPYLAGQTTGFLALFSKKLRKNFVTDLPKIKRMWPALLGGEIAYVISLTLWTYAMEGYPGAVTSALAGGYPLLILMAGPLLRRAKFARQFGNVDEAFPKVEGSWWKKATIFLGEAVGVGFLRPMPKRG